MKLTGTVLGLLFVGLGFYICTIRLQTRDVAEYCCAHPQGSLAESLFAMAKSYSGKLMGGDEFTDKVRPQSFIYCAPLTMCDVSCSLQVIDGLTTQSECIEASETLKRSHATDLQ